MNMQTVYRYLIIIVVCVMSLVSSIAMAESFGGFGIVVAQIYDADSPGNKGGIVILHVPLDTEAYKSGLKAGDIILDIDGKPTAGREFGDVVLRSLRGEAGSTSTLKIKRAQEDKLLDIQVMRAIITYE